MANSLNYGFSKSQKDIFLSINNTLFVLGIFIGGYSIGLFKNFNSRKFTICYALFNAACSALCTIQSEPLFYILRLCQGLPAGIQVMHSTGYISDISPKPIKSLGISVHSFMFSIGLILSLIWGKFDDKKELIWRLAFYFSSMLSILQAVILLTCLRNMNHPNVEYKKIRNSRLK